MADSSVNTCSSPVVRGVTYFLAHVPSLTCHGSKPSREIPKDPTLFKNFTAHLRPFSDAVVMPRTRYSSGI